ncbi:acyl-CoA thioesterase [Methylobacterium dankookense]|uniref:Acyl-CoA thioester hydrolase n=1 Tax=Methylobacterium dankookense TaxID=560405 RepID=A0A564G7Y5_9HYPH|nr:acyl-CoA thioesterase [Methylobacterium dankookense]GJD59857.1 putative acyl-CoA thioester hydrolase [Methylobacterium dankookense]VUF16094.1 putative acyl-CoA thioester hydrolase [Methylobacterium dankookense]
MDASAAALPLVRTLTLPSEANLNGGVFGGWIMAELDKAAGLLGMRRARGACSTVAVENLRFLAPLRVGEEFSIYGEVESVGRSSMRLKLDGFAASPSGGEQRRVVEALFVSVALDADGRSRPVP